MKKLFASLPVLIALCLWAPHARAQDASPATTGAQSAKHAKAGGGKKSSSRADAELADLSTNLNLTDEQKAKIKPLLEDEHTKIHAAREAKTGSADDQKAKTKVIRDDANTQIRAVLTPEQQTKFDGISKKGHKKAGSQG
jgi:Spy/CpxP family protein refolding chaperone